MRIFGISATIISILLFTSIATQGIEFDRRYQQWSEVFNVPAHVIIKYVERERITAEDFYRILLISRRCNVPIPRIVAAYRANIRHNGWSSVMLALGFRPGYRNFEVIRSNEFLYVNCGRDWDRDNWDRRQRDIARNERQRIERERRDREFELKKNASHWGEEQRRKTRERWEELDRQHAPRNHEFDRGINRRDPESNIHDRDFSNEVTKPENQRVFQERREERGDKRYDRAEFNR